MIKKLSTNAEIRDDEELVIAARSKPEAFRPLYEKYYKRIFLFVHHRVNEKSISADITSQVFLKAMLHLNKYTFQGVPFSAWLFRIAMNECNDFFRKGKRQRFVAIDEGHIEALHEELTADTGLEDLRERLPEILEKLNGDELYLLELRYFEQRPFKEIADILGISEVYAKVKIYRLLSRMRDHFYKSH